MTDQESESVHDGMFYDATISPDTARAEPDGIYGISPDVDGIEGPNGARANAEQMVSVRLAEEAGAYLGFSEEQREGFTTIQRQAIAWVEHEVWERGTSTVGDFRRSDRPEDEEKVPEPVLNEQKFEKLFREAQDVAVLIAGGNRLLTNMFSRQYKDMERAELYDHTDAVRDQLIEQGHVKVHKDTVADKLPVIGSRRAKARFNAYLRDEVRPRQNSKERKSESVREAAVSRQLDSMTGSHKKNFIR